ncbi:hypothetical protein SAMN04487928_10254 [Butyrivibrio proteoclasticus]|uniref:DUF5067 domain-containing protein n=1 Tax=Butyrivibrio proteoclasticus TaxID=43305 RepID=A0A1I5QCD3_9FIRM|nr:hypothetical protein [Butyrivibrio proteoclasticus]SFP43969.1 hypothetical protein SAMN04487928_10254 [Butyrivibrio proteoclasticus]
MRVRKVVLLFVVIMTVFSLSGCGEKFPELSEEEYNKTVEFAVGLLMKYSNNDKEKLTYVDAKEVQKERENEARKAAKEEEKKEPTVPVKVEEPEPVAESSEELVSTAMSSEEPASTAASGNEPVDEHGKETTDDAAAVSGSSDSEVVQETETDNGEKISSDVSSDAIVLSSDQTQEIVNDIFLSYQGYSVSSTYPESSKSYVVNADKGKKLLVLRFDLYNASGSSKKVNMINQKLLFQILLNGKNLGYSSVTFLPNDLSSYIGEIDSKAHESLVILTQISADDSTSIQTLGMIVSMNGTQQEVALK